MTSIRLTNEFAARYGCRWQYLQYDKLLADIPHFSFEQIAAYNYAQALHSKKPRKCEVFIRFIQFYTDCLRRFANPNKPSAEAINGNAAGTGTSLTCSLRKVQVPDEPTILPKSLAKVSAFIVSL